MGARVLDHPVAVAGVGIIGTLNGLVVLTSGIRSARLWLIVLGGLLLVGNAVFWFLNWRRVRTGGPGGQRLSDWWCSASRTDHLAGVPLPRRVLHYTGWWP